MTFSYVTAEEEGGFECEGLVRIWSISQQYNALKNDNRSVLSFSHHQTNSTIIYIFVIKIKRDCEVNLPLRVDRGTVNRITCSAFLFCHVSRTSRMSRKVMWVDDSVT